MKFRRGPVGSLTRRFDRRNARPRQTVAETNVNSQSTPDARPAFNPPGRVRRTGFTSGRVFTLSRLGATSAHGSFLGPFVGRKPCGSRVLRCICAAADFRSPDVRCRRSESRGFFLDFFQTKFQSDADARVIVTSDRSRSEVRNTSARSLLRAEYATVLGFALNACTRRAATRIAMPRGRRRERKKKLYDRFET